MPDRRLGVEIVGKDKLTPVTKRIGAHFKAAGTDMARSLTRIATAAGGLYVLRRGFHYVIEHSGQLKREFARLSDMAGKLAGRIGDYLAPAVSLLTDGFENMTKRAGAAVKRWSQQLNVDWAVTAENALRWGNNIAIQFATGLVKGAAWALTAAMTFIGNLLRRWLAPGSPPRVAPDIDAWGAGAFTEWLRGFKDAEWSVLEGLQTPLKSALSTLADLGQMAGEQVGPVFASLSVDIARALAEVQRGGALPTALFERLRVVGGQFGHDLAELARRQFAVAAATRDVERAERRLEEARKGEDKARDQIKKLRAEYKALLKAGADPALVAAKYEEIKAAQTGLRAAKAESTAAEQAVEDARKREEATQRQLDLQQRLVAQLIELAQAQLRLKEPEVGIPGIGAIELPKFELPTAEFTNIKNVLSGIFADIGQMWRAAYESEMKPVLEELAAKWQWFRGIIADFVADPRIQGIITWIKGLIPPGTIATLGEWAGAIAVATAAVWLLFTAVSIIFNPITLLGAAIVLLAALWTKHGEEIMETLRQLAFIFLYVFTTCYQNLIDFGVAFQEWQGRMQDRIQGLIDWIRAKWNGIIAELAGLFTTAKSTLYGIWLEIVDWIRKALSIDWSGIGRGIVDGIRGGIEATAHGLAERAAQMVRDAIDAAKRAVGIHSPSRLAAKQIGEPIVAGIRQAFDRDKSAARALAGMLTGMMHPPAAAPAAAGATFHNIFHVGAGAKRGDAMEIADEIERQLRVRGLRRTFR